MRKGVAMASGTTAMLAAVFLASCSTAPGNAGEPPPTAGSVETIRYETGPCFGPCPVYVVSVSSDGQGIFQGKQHTGVTGTRSFAVTAEQFAAFRDRLAPYRPSGKSRIADDNCSGSIATDHSWVEISWSGKGPDSSLYAYYGCNRERNKAMFDALRAAPEALPIEPFIGSR